ncbi:MAG: hypothetical protein ACYCOU_03900 [Sulfobacillus sp.]
MVCLMALPPCEYDMAFDLRALVTLPSCGGLVGVRTRCDHRYHAGCLRDWVQSDIERIHCPLYRAPLFRVSVPNRDSTEFWLDMIIMLFQFIQMREQQRKH